MIFEYLFDLFKMVGMVCRIIFLFEFIVIEFVIIEDDIGGFDDEDGNFGVDFILIFFKWG